MSHAGPMIRVEQQHPIQAWFSRVLNVLPPDRSHPSWHVAPVIDMLAYHWSWLWMLAPLVAFTGDRTPDDFLLAMRAVIAGNFMHQALSLAFVYLDREVFARHPKKFAIFPGTMLLLFMASLVGWKLDAPYRHVHLHLAIGTFAVVSGSWNLWHVHMQKFGILRLYNAKSRPAPGSAGIPRWVDLWLIFGWLPLYVAVLPTHHATEIYQQLPLLQPYTGLVLGPLQSVRRWTEPITAAFLAASLATFAWYEWRVNRLRNVARLSMAVGTTALGVSVLRFNLVKVVIAWGFTHVLEYVVFTWAYQRRYYRTPRPHHPPLERILRWPTVAFASFVLVVGGAYLTLLYFSPWQQIGGIPLSVLIQFSTLYLAVSHFFVDGFLWKMRKILPSVTANSGSSP